jgi:ABC transporter substrate binding protein (PQQ-dependent alcohol dehydrogenase system)
MIVGIAEDAGGVLSTVPYLRAPYVFVSREDRDIAIESLDDPVLRELSIGTYQRGIPSFALDNRDIAENVTEYPPVASPAGPDRSAAILDAVTEGEVDVGIVYGPEAARRELTTDVELRRVPVTPEIDVGATLIQLFRTWTIGVRPHDESLRDRLNLALAERWEDVQVAIDEYGVHQLDIPRPPTEEDARAPAVGLVAPTESGGVVPLQNIGMPALHGAELAENVLARREDRREQQVRVLYASAPTDDAAVRAARRLVATENLFALVGGFSDERAARLAEIAETGDVLFFNVASLDPVVRAESCARTSFHVEASAPMYLDAALDWFLGRDHERVFVVHEDDETGQALADRASARLADAEGGAELVGTAAVERGQFVFTEAVSAAVDADADLVLLLLRPEDQELFISQYGTSGTAVVSGLAYPEAQTRPFLYGLRDANQEVGRSPRIALWDASLADGPAAELNDRYASRTNRPMEPSAWASFAAVVIAFEAADAVEDLTTDALVAYLESPEVAFDVGKATEVSFRPWNHQLRQELYAVQVDAEATWGRPVTDRIAIADVVGRLPNPDGDPSLAALDRYGVGADANRCGF